MGRGKFKATRNYLKKMKQRGLAHKFIKKQEKKNNERERR